MRIVVFGDGAWAADTLVRLAEEHQIAGVVARVQPSDAALQQASALLGLPFMQPPRVNSPESIAAVAALCPDLLLSISYNQILQQPLLQTARFDAINVHAGKLPFYRGRNVINWAIINGEREIGITIHRMNQGIDTGDVLLQHTLPIGWSDTYGDVLGRVIEHIPGMVLETVALIAAGRTQPQPQAGAGTYFGGRTAGDEWLDWSDTSCNLHNKIRAISRPGPGARTLLNGQQVTIWRAYAAPDWPHYLATPGQVVGRQSDGVMVKTGDSTLLVQAVGDGETTPRWPIGTRLGLDMMAYVQTLAERIVVLERQLTLKGESDDQC